MPFQIRILRADPGIRNLRQRAWRLLLACLLSNCPSPKSVLAEVVVFGTGSNQFSMDFALVGSPGNPADDTSDSSPNQIPVPIGGVNYVFKMGKHEASRDMVIKGSAQGGLGITLFDMTSFGGNGTNRPATGVTWLEAARFVNWLNASQGYPHAYKFSAQPGEPGYSTISENLLWNSTDPGFDSSNRFRNALARFALPSADEWHKAAYYDPAGNGGSGAYFNFPNGANSAPTAISSGIGQGTAVYGQSNSQGPANINDAGGLSTFGVMGLGGNVYEIDETENDFSNDLSSSRRGARGGQWDSPLIPNFLRASLRQSVGLSELSHSSGFRVVDLRPDLPGDFNADQRLDCLDIDGLVARIAAGAGPTTFDLTGDGIVDSTDLHNWLSVAGEINLGPGRAYRLGDANLDGVVDGSDFGIWNGNKFRAVAAWCRGDFSADGVVDGSDFAAWNANKFTASDANGRLVPEPSDLWWLLSVLLALAHPRLARLHHRKL